MRRNRGPPITQRTFIKWGVALLLLWIAPNLLTAGLILALVGLAFVILNRRFFANTIVDYIDFIGYEPQHVSDGFPKIWGLDDKLVRYGPPSITKARFHVEL